MPPVIEPQLVTLVERRPTDGDWSYEIKFDGYRMLARLEDGVVNLIKRNGHDWTFRLPRLREALLSQSNSDRQVCTRSHPTDVRRRTAAGKSGS